MNRASIVLPLMLLIAMIGAGGQTLIKRALNGLPAGATAVGVVTHLLADSRMYLGVILGGAGTLLWFVVLARADLSYATPFVGLGMVMAAVFSVVFLGESVGPIRIAGTTLIVIGAALVARS